jgi:hypothetical protein
MSWSLQIIGRDKEKLKEAVREQQCKDEVNAPHSGVPRRVVDFICSEIDRVRIYTYQGRVYGVNLNASGSFHDQGITESIRIDPVQLIE